LVELTFSINCWNFLLQLRTLLTSSPRPFFSSLEICQQVKWFRPRHFSWRWTPFCILPGCGPGVAIGICSSNGCCASIFSWYVIRFYSNKIRLLVFWKASIASFYIHDWNLEVKNYSKATE
jgi:hypothetical protein